MFTVITYRPNKLVTCLGTVQECHDSALAISVHKTEEDVKTFLTQEHLTDLRRQAVDSWGAVNEYKFLVDGAQETHQWNQILADAKFEGARLFILETAAKRAREEQERAELAARVQLAQRCRDIKELKRILSLYSTQELRDELMEFSL